MKRVSFPMPLCPDPVVNTPLLALESDAESPQRFWISTYNDNLGSRGILVDEFGGERIFHLGHVQGGFYSAVQEDANTLWLCGNLSRVVRLALDTEAVEVYETGAPSTLMFQGMVFDRATGKLFAAAFSPPRTAAFSFDCRSRRPAKVYDNVFGEHCRIGSSANYMRHSFANGDGTYSCYMEIPGQIYLLWNPQQETLSAFDLSQIPQMDANFHFRICPIPDDVGRRYLPSRGWFDPIRREVTAISPHPEREMSWFDRQGNQAWGSAGGKDGTPLTLGVWNLEDSSVRDLCEIPYPAHLGVRLTRSGNLIAVNQQGEFFCFDAQSGENKIHRQLSNASIARVDCLCRIDGRRLIGTPFISQRFWEIDLQTGKSRDCGRAAPGEGEILKTWSLGSKLYMAAYTGGELTEYDPDQPPNFPVNPRVVAHPPGALRPVAAADDGQRLYYSCTNKYGRLGGVLTRYDTRTGESLYSESPIPDEAVDSLLYDSASCALLGGTTIYADNQSCPPRSEAAHFIRIDPETLRLNEALSCRSGVHTAVMHGPLATGKYLASTVSVDGSRRWLSFSPGEFQNPAALEMPFLQGSFSLISTHKPSWFILHREHRFELWNVDTGAMHEVLYDNATEKAWAYLCEIQGDSIYFARTRDVLIFEGFLKDF